VLDNIKVKGAVVLTLTDAKGNVKELKKNNLVVNHGLALIADRLKDASTPVLSHIAIGTSGVAPATGNVALNTEVARVAIDSVTTVTETVAGDTIQYVATFPPGTGTGAIVEAAILNAASNGIMLSRIAFGVINKNALDSLAITWKISIV